MGHSKCKTEFTLNMAFPQRLTHSGGGTRNLRFCVKKSIIQLGNILPTSTRDNPNQGRVYSVFGIAPCLTNLSRGGGREPMIIWEENYE